MLDAVGERRATEASQNFAKLGWIMSKKEPVFASSRAPFVIAEAGVNHNGDPVLARELVHAAKEAGADCVKFQTFRADRVATASAPKAAYQLLVTDPAESQIAMLRKLEMDEAFHVELIELCRKIGIEFLSTPYNFVDVDFLDSLGVFAFKLASLHCAEPAFVEYAAKKGRPLILSTGMATLAEVDAAIRAIRNAGDPELVVLQCTTDYPAKIEDANLNAMATIRAAFGVDVGYSDHTVGATACIASVALGATVIEKHLTLDRKMPGPDHATSMEPDEFAALVRALRATRQSLGSSLKQPSASERRNMTGMRRSIVAARALTAGTKLSLADLDFRRPATGIPAASTEAFIGRELARDVAAGAQLDWSDIGAPRGNPG